MKHLTTKDKRAKQGGYVLPLALVLLILSAFILTSVTTAIHRKWSAAEQELFVQQELMTYNPATTLLDICMASLPSSEDPTTSLLCGHRGSHDTSDGWTTIDAPSGCDGGTHARCWRVIEVDDTKTVQLASGIGDRELLEVHIQIAVGCHGAIDMVRDCGRLGLLNTPLLQEYVPSVSSSLRPPGVLTRDIGCAP